MFAELSVQVLACGSSVCFLLFTMSTPWQDRQWGCASWDREWWDHGWWRSIWWDRERWQLESEPHGDATERSVDLHHAVAAHPAVTAPSPPTNIAGQSSVRIDADEVPQGAATEHSVDLHHAGTERLAAAESEQHGDATERSVDLHHAVAAHPAVTAPSPPTNIAGQSSVRIDADEVPQGAATEHSVDLHHAGTERLAAAERSPQRNAASGSCATAGGGLLSCPVCQRAICQTRDLAFFHRHNPQGGTEVHLMLKPEHEVPPTLVPTEELDKGATRTWNCLLQQ